MKSTSQTVYILILIMLLLVLGAAFFFLFQGRQTLEGNVAELDDEVGALAATKEALNSSLVQEQTLLNSTDATRTIAEIQLATAQAENLTLSDQLVDSDAAQATLNALLAVAETSEGELAATREAELLQPPQVAIIAPEAGEQFFPQQPIKIIVVAVDPAGVMGLSILSNETELVTEAITPGTLITHTVTWAPPEAGSYLLQVAARNSNGVISDPALLTIVVDISPAFLQSQPQGSTDLTAAIRLEIATAVQTIRQIEPDGEPEIILTSVEEIESVIAADLLPAQKMADLALLLRALGLLNAESDLAELLMDALVNDREVYYDASSESLYLTAVTEMDPDLQRTYAAAYTRYLQDNAYATVEPAPDIFSDAGLAVLALATGEERFVQALFASEVLQLNPIELASLDQAPLFPETVPAVLTTYLSFPAVVGEAFVNVLLAEEVDLDVLDEVWAAPPVSSEQVLHPDKYRDGEAPLPVELPALEQALEGALEPVVVGVLGEWRLRQMLAAPGSSSQIRLTADEVAEMAGGWGGDQYAVYTDESGEEVMLVLQIAWDTAGDADEFRASFANYALSTLPDGAAAALFANAECWQDDVVLCLLATAGGTVIVRAPDEELAATVLEVFASTE